MAKQKTKARGPGRLSAEDTAQLEDRLLDAAQTVFLAQGFARTTIDAIAKEAGATRKTVYARYADKEAIFFAVIARVIDGAIAEPQPRLVVEADARAQLLHLAHDLIAFVSLPLTAGLNRLVYTESHQTPDLLPLLNVLHERGIVNVCTTLTALRDQGALPKLPNPRLSAIIFIEMVSSTARIRGMMAATLPSKQVDTYVETAVDIFMRGCGYRSKA